MVGLFGALDQVHADQLEVTTVQIALANRECMANVADRAATRDATNTALMGRINRSLLLGPVTGEVAVPGSVYLVSALTKAFRDDMEGLILDTLVAPNPQWQQAKRDDHAAAVASSIPIAVEITPVWATPREMVYEMTTSARP
jgi:hypothetical protein